MLAEFDAESMKRAGVQAVQETFDHELSAQIEPFDLVDDFGFKIFFDGHEMLDAQPNVTIPPLRNTVKR